MRFERGKILMISPQGWDHINVSKHHYARVAAESGSVVTFVDPPSPVNKNLLISPTESANIFRCSYPIQKYKNLKFHCRPLYNLLEHRLVRRIVQGLGGAPDLLWSFDANRFFRLNHFQAGFNLFHPVDVASPQNLETTAREAELILSVSNSILDSIQQAKARKIHLTHGIAPCFEALANNVSPWHRHKGRLKIGYAGNLTRPIVAREIMLSLIEHFPEIDFHLWGNDQEEKCEDPGGVHFIRKLKQYPNVVRYGTQPTAKLAEYYAGMDMFLLAYKEEAGLYDLSNSHKVLEYLSSGRVLLSSPLGEFSKGPADFIVFPSSNSVEGFRQAFQRVVGNLEHYNSELQSKKRREFAFENSYRNHWRRILEWMAQARSAGPARN